MLLVRHYVTKSPIHNLGLFLGEPVLEGREIWRYEPHFDVEISGEMLARLDEPCRQIILECAEYFQEREIYRLGNDADIFMNHSDRPNLIDLGNSMIAARDIFPGEELTCDYLSVHVVGFRPDAPLDRAGSPG